MTYAQIKQLALRQLDEDPHDMDEFGDLLGTYVNEGYQTALIDYYRPREVYTLKTDAEGNADLTGLKILHITGYGAPARPQRMGDAGLYRRNAAYSGTQRRSQAYCARHLPGYD